MDACREAVCVEGVHVSKVMIIRLVHAGADGAMANLRTKHEQLLVCTHAEMGLHACNIQSRKSPVGRVYEVPCATTKYRLLAMQLDDNSIRKTWFVLGSISRPGCQCHCRCSTNAGGSPRRRSTGDILGLPACCYCASRCMSPADRRYCFQQPKCPTKTCHYRS